MYLQYGCGHSAPKEWVNFDASPTLRLERLPFFGSYIQKNAIRFPQNVLSGDIVSGLPISNGTVRGLYASHVLEHLSRNDLKIALQNSFSMLAHGGTFRLVVPDLETRVRLYLAAVESKSHQSSDLFMRMTLLGREERPQNIFHRIIESISNSAHLWMWDYYSLSHQLSLVGFQEIRRCEFGDSDDPMFSLVESYDRFYDGEIVELAIEAKKT